MFSLSLHAVLRFQKSPPSLAADHLLTIVGREGHYLDAESVRHLYTSIGCDLRSALTTLDFWCQMTVGSSRGGLDWLIDRWPVGIDLDESGHKMRIISKDTYANSEAYIAQNTATDEWSLKEQCEERIYTLMRDQRFSLEQINSQLSSSSSDCGTLEQFEIVSESLSSTDVFCRLGVRDGFAENIDPEQPEPSEKEHRDDVEGSRHILSNPKQDYTDLDRRIVATIFTLLLGVRKADTNPYQMAFDENYNPRSGNLSRKDFACLDPIAVSDKATTTDLFLSSLDREFRVIVEDIAPYVRDIAEGEIERDEEKARFALALGGGQGGKKIRMTRASRTAVEGGRREEKRRDRWFSKDLNPRAVLETGAKGFISAKWAKAAEATVETSEADSSSSGKSDDDE